MKFELDIVRFSVADVITTSNTGDCAGTVTPCDGDGGGRPD